MRCGLGIVVLAHRSVNVEVWLAVIRKYSIHRGVRCEFGDGRGSRRSRRASCGMLPHTEAIVSAVAWWTTVRLFLDALKFVLPWFPIAVAPAAENRFLRKQLTLYPGTRVKPRRADDAISMTRVMLSQVIDSRAPLTIVKPTR